MHPQHALQGAGGNGGCGSNPEAGTPTEVWLGPHWPEFAPPMQTKTLVGPGAVALLSPLQRPDRHRCLIVMQVVNEHELRHEIGTTGDGVEVVVVVVVVVVDVAVVVVDDDVTVVVGTVGASDVGHDRSTVGSSIDPAAMYETPETSHSAANHTSGAFRPTPAVLPPTLSRPGNEN